MKKRIIFTLQSVLLILCVTSSLMSCEAFQEENGWVNPELVTRVDTVVVDHYIRDSIFVHDTICVGDTIVITDTLIITVHDTIPGEDPIRTEKYVLQHNVVEGGAIVSDLQPTWLEIDGISVAYDLVEYGVNGYNTQAGSVQVDSTKFAVVSKSPQRKPTSTGMRPNGNTVTTASGDYVFELNSGSKYVVSTSAEAATGHYTVDGSSSYTANLLYTIDTDVNFEKANQTMFSDTIHDDGLVKQKMMEEATFVITRKQRPVSGAEVAMDERVTVTQEGWVVVDTLPVIPPPIPVDTVGILSATFSYVLNRYNQLDECLLARTKDSVFVFINKKLCAVEQCSNPMDYNSALLLTTGWVAGVIEIGGPGKGVRWWRSINGKPLIAEMVDSSINTFISSGSMKQGSSKSDMLQQCTVQNLGDGTTKIWLRGSVYMTISHR